ncbi:hypothetical protein G3M53_91480 [Streptomyces sp. SID7982]|uniref:hypothetical protein n=1 Tax=Streptomyces sp. SID5614 TaxID=2690306 RepID=UPI00136B1853|nr:hypothetical protein [Streptomyces sp. SID5614]MZG04642.1 hypothetical protein [Streptomyces sp. SID5614]NEE41579.1 hypothetical protein [Streptomyces sp. SID7982]
MKRALAHLLLFVLTVLEMALGVIAGSVALLSLIAETAARVTAAGGDAFARHFRLTPTSPRLREELAALLSTMANPAGGTR